MIEHRPRELPVRRAGPRHAPRRRLTIDEGELCLVVGRTGVGQVDAARRDQRARPALHRRPPRRDGSRSTGATRATHPPRELADVVGVVGQDPLAGFVTDTVEEELAYGMEQLALPPDVMRKRVEETLDLLGHRRAARAARSARSPAGSSSASRSAPCSPRTRRVLVLDEPTSALDPTAAEEVLAAVTRLVHDLGVTVVMAEHRLERVVQYADRVVHLAGDGARRGRRRRADDARTIAESRRRSSSSAGSPGGTRCRCRCATRAGCAAPLRARLGVAAPRRGRRAPRRRRPAPARA